VEENYLGSFQIKGGNVIDKPNWKAVKKYLDYRLHVDQIITGSMKKEQTHLRYLLEWAQDHSFRQSPNVRPTFPEYMLSARLDGEDRQLSAVYIKKALATARLFFTWLADNETGYKHIKQSWIKTIKAKRLTNPPKISEYVTLEEIQAIAATSAHTVFERRTRAALVFLFLSGMRIGAFVSLPLCAVDIASRSVMQYPSLGVRTKNNKHAKTFLFEIPELLEVVRQWDDEVRAVLPPNGFWFAPLSPETGQIDASVIEVGEHRTNLARRNFKQWFEQNHLTYHSPHKFRHGNIHFGLANSQSVSDYKAVSMNAMHSSMEITDQFYSILQDDELKNKIGGLNKNNRSNITEGK